MASKRQASSWKQPDSREKKLKVGGEEDTWSSTLATLKTAPKEKPPATIDGQCPLSTAPGARVYEDYDCTLNQTNISANNNKFYIIQLLEHDGAYSVWSHWGRVGEVGQSKLMPCASLEAAKKDFEKKFREKTKNSWAARENFIAQPGKYTLIEVQPGAGQEVEVALRVDAVDGGKVCRQRVLPCTLDQATQDLVSLIFSSDMFRDAMQTMNIDVKKMPLGKLSKQQIARGFEALEELEAALKEQPPQAARLEELSSRFYTIVPHNFGRARPPTINSPDLLRAKKDMLLVLADIEVAQSLKAEKMKEEEEEEEKEVPHPLDQDYALLCCQLSLLDPASREYQLIKTYVTQTGNNLRILNIWQVARDGEEERFKAHDLLEHRRLLWHGTNVAVVAAILKSGLRIMPHSGGRVGKGIYFSSENSKSASYVGCTSKRVGIMFLTEVALGKPYRITRDDPTLCQPPAGYDSVLACGRTEPDPAQDEEVLLDGKKVLVCQGKPIPMAAYKDSSFSQSEYLIYQESQCRIRYLVQLCF
ncbi:LOW QUALITY PROTEIN: protein mono-ADP-ribosyltransferase PARP3-like [Oenanthe melanoleuca]|uniref:LOW QUALITY PROTEIN: protein mono-ADP-ribosyltransferase PARP3-like n=1 Tax=Oenanthe melanoleuca TaxID=2939378 RepID=UPI0024C11ABA|nr:LOW QUALITY PROTEIN: protein mono-ADP-ribosyltransferase PARP3-like [Oenanthe melanoleuca]